MKDRLANLISTWFGTGHFPIAPGTAASAVAIAIAYPLVRFGHWPPFFFLILAAAGVPACVWAASSTARQRGEVDPRIVVSDEVLGQWVSLAGITVFNWKSWLSAFLLFRLFDIWKPPPVRQLEALPSGTGIVADDLMAGVYAALVLFAAGCFNLY